MNTLNSWGSQSEIEEWRFIAWCFGGFVSFGGVLLLGSFLLLVGLFLCYFLLVFVVVFSPLKKKQI